METMFKKLTTLIRESDNVMIMAHHDIDMDAFGSSLALYEIVKSFDKNAYVFLENLKDNIAINHALECLENSKINISFLDEKNYIEKKKKNSLLVILDVYKQEMLEFPDVVTDFDHIVVIDHHVKNNKIQYPTLFEYISPDLSSINEIMVNYLKYLNKTVNPVIATSMLAGIEIDTNQFNVKTTDKTYEAAAFLTKIGANHILKQELLKEDRNSYLKRQHFVKKSFMVNKNMAMCILDEEHYERKDLAVIAEELLKFDDVEASFVIGRLDKETVYISARSIGKIDVEQYMRKLGGGGHTTDAAARFENQTIADVKNNLLNILNGE